MPVNEFGNSGKSSVILSALAGLGTGIILIVLFAMFINASISPAFSTYPRIEQNQAIRITEKDLQMHSSSGNQTRSTIAAITPALADSYRPASEFLSGDLQLPLEYYHSDNTFYEVNSTSHTIIGKWRNDQPAGGFHQYNGKFGPYLELGKGRLYWILDCVDSQGTPCLYSIDAMTGEILDSPYIRSTLRGLP